VNRIGLCLIACASLVSGCGAGYGMRFEAFGLGDAERFRGRLREIYPEGTDVGTALSDLQSAGARCRVERVVIASDGSVRFINPHTGLGVPGPRDVSGPDTAFYARASQVHQCVATRPFGTQSFLQYGISLFADPHDRLVRLTATIGNYQ
jgi:hypothetical protein